VGGEEGPAARDRRNKSRCDFPCTHMANQSVDRCLPFRIGHFLRNALVGDDARIVLCQRYEDQDAAALLGVGDAAN
jgi:hypothetical protein